MALRSIHIGNTELFRATASLRRTGLVMGSGSVIMTTITDELGDPMPSVTLPAVFNLDDATAGIWALALLIPDDPAILGKVYTAEIDMVDAVSGAVGHLEQPLLVAERRV